MSTTLYEYDFSVAVFNTCSVRSRAHRLQETPAPNGTASREDSRALRQLGTDGACVCVAGLALRAALKPACRPCGGRSAARLLSGGLTARVARIAWRARRCTDASTSTVAAITCAAGRVAAMRRWWVSCKAVPSPPSNTPRTMAVVKPMNSHHVEEAAIWKPRRC
jgi:hypothetical protein